MSKPSDLTLGDILAQHARTFPARTAAVCGDVRLSWPDLDQRVDRLVGVLSVAQVAKGDRVVWLGQNCHRVLEGILAAARLGAVFCPVNWRQSAAELAFILEDAQPGAVLWQAEEVGDAASASRVATPEALWIQHDGPGIPGEYEDALATHGSTSPPDEEVDPGSSVVMLYTAAFDGQPNGALLSHRALIHQSLITSQVQGTTTDDTYLNAGPLFHVGTLRHTLSTFQLGGTNVFTPRVEPTELCRLIHEERCTGAFLQRPTMDEMVRANERGDYDLSSLRTPPATAEWNAMVTVEERPLTSGYGQTELAGVVLFRGLGGAGIGGAGRPTVASVRIMDPESSPVPTGAVGEIVVRGPMVMNGYHNRAELTAARQRAGWHHTSDLGRQEIDGTFSFIGPMSRIVKSAAENIYPAEVEGCLATHDAVREAGVIGVPDPIWTQAVVAVVVLHDGAAASAEELIVHCRDRIASYKKPKRVEFVDALPRTPSGIVDYDALDERFGGGGYPSSG